MPTYVYLDAKGHTQEISHRMLYGTAIICECGLTMLRVPQSFRVNWNGRAPSAGDISPVVQQMIDNAPRGRDEYKKRKENHVKKTKAESERLAASDPTYGRVTRK